MSKCVKCSLPHNKFEFLDARYMKVYDHNFLFCSKCYYKEIDDKRTKCLTCHNPVEKGYDDNITVDLVHCIKCYNNNDVTGLRKQLQDMKQELYEITENYKAVCKRYELDIKCYSCGVFFNTDDSDACWKNVYSQRICRECSSS